MSDLPDIFDAYPTVYAVRDRYVITVPVTGETVMWVRVGEHEYFDDSNGILRSARNTHKMEVPAAELDREREYTVCFRRVRERKPYFSDVGDVETFTSDFRPVTGDVIHIYQLADAHNRVDGPVAAGSYFGDDLDLLILNGDIPNHSGDISYFSSIHRIASGITHGRIPVIFSRGNHDTRGIYAENIADYTPTDNGKSYFPVRVGNVWALVLDCAEDKPDGNAEYGHTICCHDFRMRESAFLEQLIKHPEDEYEADGVEHRLVIVHNPFTQTFGAPFDIEQDTFAHWAELLREYVHPELMICGHVHRCYLSEVGSGTDHKGQPCPVVVASRLDNNNREYFAGAAITLTPDNINIRFTDNLHTVFGEHNMPRK